MVTNEYIDKWQHIWNTQRHCHYCGCRLIGYRNSKRPEFINSRTGRLKGGFGLFTVDHKIPKVKGGTDDLDNLVACCWDCNTKKNRRDYEEFLRTVKPNLLPNDDRITIIEDD